MKKVLSVLLAHALWFICGTAAASYHTFEIVQIYSNADGTIQFVLLHEFAGSDGEQFLGGHTLTATRGATTKTFVFNHDLPSSSTAGRYVLVATQGYVDAAASYPQFASVFPDYVIPNQFVPTDGGHRELHGRRHCELRPAAGGRPARALHAVVGRVLPRHQPAAQLRGRRFEPAHARRHRGRVLQPLAPGITSSATCSPTSTRSTPAASRAGSARAAPFSSGRIPARC
jgi:hypothetical protein